MSKPVGHSQAEATKKLTIHSRNNYTLSSICGETRQSHAHKKSILWCFVSCGWDRAMHTKRAFCDSLLAVVAANTGTDNGGRSAVTSVSEM